MNRSPLLKRWEAGGSREDEGAPDETAKGPAASDPAARPAVVRRFGEIRPTDVAPVIASNRAGARAVYPMKWGYTGKSLLVNARSETAAVKPTFREDWARHRCIVPTSWYFEWEHEVGDDGRKRTGDKYRIRPEGADMTWLCGLYRMERGMPVFVVLTREPGAGIRFIHDRMPLIMPDHLAEEWIRPDVNPEALLPCALTEMAFEKAEPDGAV